MLEEIPKIEHGSFSLYQIFGWKQQVLNYI